MGIEQDGRQAGRTASKKLEMLAQKSEINTPWAIFRSFSPRGIFRGMGVLPKNYVYLTKNRYAKRDKGR